MSAVAVRQDAERHNASTIPAQCVFVACVVDSPVDVLQSPVNTSCCRLLLTISHTKTLLLISIFGPVSFGLAFGSPAVLIEVKRYTGEV